MESSPAEVEIRSVSKFPWVVMFTFLVCGSRNHPRVYHRRMVYWKIFRSGKRGPGCGFHKGFHQPLQWGSRPAPKLDHPPFLPDQQPDQGRAGISAPRAFHFYHALPAALQGNHKLPGWQFSLPPDYWLSLIHISEPTRLGMISYAVFCL